MDVNSNIIGTGSKFCVYTIQQQRNADLITLMHHFIFKYKVTWLDMPNSNNW